MNQAFQLYRLQQIDTQIDQAEASIAEVERLLAEDETVQTTKREFEKFSKELHQAQQGLKQAEFAVHEQQMKIAQSESSLYSGRLHNPKELQDLQKEIVSLKKYLGVLEDHQLEAMIHLEQSESRASAAQAAMDRAQAAFVEKSAGWLGQKEQSERNLERLHAERAAALSQASADSLQVYESLRKRKSGLAVTTAKDGSCTFCGATIRPSELQAARSAAGLIYCNSCGRILYAG